MDKKIPTRKRILHAAEEVFSEYGFHKALVEEIARRAGLGKGTIYRYFDTKEKLFKSLMDENALVLKEMVLYEINKHEGIVDKMKADIKTYLHFFEQHKKLFFILIFEEDGIGCKNHAELWEKRMSHAGLLEAFIAEGVAQNVFKNLDPKSLSYSILGILHYMVIKWMRSEEEYDILDDLDVIYEIIFNGIQINEAKGNI